MNILYKTIKQLDKEEVRVFKTYLNRTFEAERSRKDVSLFDLYRKCNDDPDDEKLAIKLGYGTGDMNAYYRLKNRLLEEINKILVLRQAEKDVYAEVLHLFHLYAYYVKKEQADLAFYFLKRAEKLAQASEYYDLLDMLYGEFIRLSQKILEINPETYTRLRKENLEKLNLAREIDQIIAVLNYRLKIGQNIGEDTGQILEIYSKTVDEYTRDPLLLSTPQFRIRMYKAISRILVQRQDFESLEILLIRTFSEFEELKIFQKHTQELKVEMLIYLVNTLNARKKYSEALKFCQKLKLALEEYDRLLYARYSYFYYQGIVAAYAPLNPDKAIETLNEMLKKRDFTVDDFYDIFIYSNLAICHASRKDYHAALKNLNKVYLHDKYEKTAPLLQYRLVCYEMLVRFELGDNEIIEYKLERFLKEKEADTGLLESREGKFIQLIFRWINGAGKHVPEQKALALDILREDEHDLLSRWAKSRFNL